MSDDIRRAYEPGRTRARAAVFDQLVVTVSTARAAAEGLEAQAAATLHALDQNLQESGSDKTRILFALVFLADIEAKPEFNRAWDAWVDKAAPPVRACVGAQLQAGDLVEIVAIASTRKDALGDEKSRFNESQG